MSASFVILWKAENILIKYTRTNCRYVSLDINPFSWGHSLVIPKRHVPWWRELSLEENVSLFRVAKIETEKMMKTLEPELRLHLC